MLIYRIARWLFTHNIPIIPRFLELLIYFFYNSVIPSKAEIGEKTYLSHGGLGVVIHPQVKIGKGVIINTGVTIGGKSLSAAGFPIIGDDVYIGTGAKIIGNIKIENNCVIGANAVVIDSVPSGSVVGGVPARILKSGINAREIENW
jgi:serine O-acetyltransferase